MHAFVWSCVSVNVQVCVDGICNSFGSLTCSQSLVGWTLDIGVPVIKKDYLLWNQELPILLCSLC